MEGYYAITSVDIVVRLLLVEYVAATAAGDKAENALLRKEKQPLPFPVRLSSVIAPPCIVDSFLQLCFWRFRPTKVCSSLFIHWARTDGRTDRPTLCIRSNGPLCNMSSFDQVRRHLTVPSSAYLQFAPAVSIVGIITEAFGVLCPQSYSPHFAQVYITSIDFISIR